MLGLSLAWQIYNACIPIFLQAGRPDFQSSVVNVKGFGLDPTRTGFIMTLDNIAALFLLPYIGVLSDRTRTRLGRRRPYILVGMPLAVIAFLSIPAALNVSLAALMAALIAFLLAMDLFRTPLAAMMPDLTPSRHRSVASGILVVLGNVGTIAAYGLGGMLLKQSAAAPFLLGGIGLLVTVLVVLLFVREPSRPEAEANHAAREAPSLLPLLRSLATEAEPSARLLLLAVFTWTMASSTVEIFMSSFIIQRFAIDAGSATMMMAFFGMAAFAGAFPAGMIGKRFGRRRAIQTGLILIACLLGSALFVPSVAMMRLALAGMGLTWSLVMVNGLPMVLDLSRSRDTGGTYSGLFLLAGQGAAIAGPVLAGAVLDLAHRDYRALFLYIPVLMLIALFLMRGVRRGEAHTAAA
jgi:Na+/melibiose symporter-like transporter